MKLSTNNGTYLNNLVIFSFQLHSKNQSMLKTPTSLTASSLSKLLTVQPPKALRKFSQNAEFNFYLMFFVTQAVSQSAISNGLKILNTLDGVVFSENGNKNQRKI